MTYTNFLRALGFVLALALGLPIAQASQTQASAIVAGHIAFINGQVQVQNPAQSVRTLSNGAPVYVGDQFQTLSGSYLHLRMVDNAFVALRPDSQLTIEAYDYNPDQPQASRIRLDLQHGTSRAVSGKGGQAAKHQYRFNTPLAAIGLRGTDYTVIADNEKTRVSVAQGGVIVSPYGAGCSSAQLGPCTGALSRELNATMPGAYIEITGNQKPGILINGGTERQAPASKEGQSISAADISTAQSTATAQAQAEAQIVHYATQPADSQATVRWGRWSSLVQAIPQGSGSINDVLGSMAPFKLVAANNAFALGQPSTTLANLPTQGQVNLSLVAAEAYTQQGNQFSPANVKNGILELDFGKKTFNTQLTVVTQTAQTEKLQAQGGFDAYGFLQSAANANTNVKGALFNKGQEAAYLFDKTLSTGTIISGAAQWGR